MTVNDAIKRALRLIGVLDPGVEPDSYMQADALMAINGMLASWSAKRSAIYAPVTVFFPTVAGTAVYTIGTGGDVDTGRPKRILKAWTRQSDGTDTTLRLRAMSNYVDIPDKTVQSEPSDLYHEEKYPVGDLYLYPVPDQVYTIWLKLWAAFPVYATVTESLGLPLEYEDAICSNIAVRLAPEYQRPISQELALMATDSYSTIRRINVQPIPQIPTNPLYVSHSRSILEG